MRIARGRIGHRIFFYSSGARIELADIRFEIRREPNVAVLISSEAMRPGAGCFQWILFDFSCLWIEPALLVCELHRLPQRATRRDCRIVWTRILSRHLILTDGFAD